MTVPTGTGGPAAATRGDAPDPPDQRGKPRAAPARLSPILERYGLLLLLMSLVTFFAVHPTSGRAFRSIENIQALLANQAVGLVVALALLVPFSAGFFDFSVGALTTSSCLVAATSLSRFDLPLVPALALAVLFGLLVGTATGLLVAYLGTNPFIATLGVATLLGGVVFAYTQGLQITTGIPTVLTDLGSATWWQVPRIVLVAVAAAVVVWFVMTQAPFGRRLAAVGSNARAAHLVGIDVRRVQLAAFAVAGAIAGLAGILLLARQGAATSDNGMTMLFPALTAVLLGTITADVGRPSVTGTAVGILFVAVSVSGLTLIGAPAWVSQVFNGAALLVAVAFAGFGRRTART
jgi:ribose transport system permease protein